MNNIQQNEKIRSERNFGIDLLRMTAMFMVALLHVLGQGGVLKSYEKLTVGYELAWFFETAAYCAVNCYALISGYVGINSKFKYYKIVLTHMNVTFYTLIITAVFALVKKGSVGVSEIFGAIFPAMTTQYWYFTAYFALFFMMPILNFVLNNMEKKKLGVAILSLTVLLSVLTTLFRKDAFDLNGGYSILWLVLLYLIGGYAAKYKLGEKISSKVLILGYFGAVFVSWLAKFAIEFASKYILGEVRWVRFLIDYISPTMLVAAVCLLLLFKRIKVGTFGKKLIGFLAPCAFSVYIIHTNPLVWKYIMENAFVWITELPVWLLVPIVLLCAFAIYLLCSLVDTLRVLLFSKLSLSKRLALAEDKILEKITSRKDKTEN